MNQRRLLSLILLLMAFACQAQPNALWEIRGQNTWGIPSEFETIGNTNYFTNGAVVSNINTVVTMDYGTADNLTGEVVAEGDVTILDHGHIWRGTNFVYNFKTGAVRATTFKTAQEPFSVTGESLRGSNSVYNATNVFITTDDYATSGYRIRARHITIIPGKSFEADHATLYWGKIPIFYFPYYHRTLGQHPNNFEYEPGYRSLFGPYLLSAYNWYGNGLLDGTLHLDVRETRGIAAGPDFLFHLGNLGEGAFRYYYAYDQQPNADDLNEPHLDKNRQRLSFYYHVEPTTNLTVKAVANYQSDPLVIHDFFENEYKTNVEPASYLEVQQLSDNYTLNLLVQPRLVTFFETVERLPDLKLSGARQQVGETPLFYENESSVGYYVREFSNTNTPYYLTNGTLAPSGLDYYPVRTYYPNPANYEAARADTFHQLTLPETFFDWLNVTPRVGGRLTYYGDVDGPAIHTNAQVRGVFNTGMDVSFKASKVYSQVENDLLDVHEIRHIFEPDIDYVWVPAPSRSPSQLPQFDYQSPSLRQLPIEFPDYNSIDSIDSMNVVRLTLRNILQTKRQDGVQDLVNFAVYGDWSLTPGTNHPFSDLYSDLDFRPRSWITFGSSVRYDMADERWREAIEHVLIQPSSSWSVALSYRYLMNNDPEFQDFPGETVPGHNLIAASVYYRMNENWGAHFLEQYEAQDGIMQEQVYSIYRDLRSWTAALTFRVIQGEGVPTDYTVAVTFSLKAFPRFGLGSDSDRSAQVLDTPASASTDR
jgi:lipopolysaccharide assembly outer membrane protein LptD (OstA)